MSPTGYAIPVNTSVIVNLSESVDQGSLNDLALTLVTDEGYYPEAGKIYTSGNLTQIVLDPHGLLRKNTRYRAMAPSPGMKSKADGDYLEESYVWRFTTADTIDASGETILWEAGVSTADILGTTTVTKVSLTDGDGIEDGDIKIPSGQIGFDIEFNSNKAGAGPSGTLEWLSGYITMTGVDVLGYDYDEGTELATTFEVLQEIEGYSPVINIRDKNEAGSQAGMLENSEYTLTVKKGVQASGYLPMASNFVVSWTTRFHPTYSTSVLVRLLAGPFLTAIPDDTINRQILNYSRRATRLNGNTIYTTVPYYVTDYVTCQAAADLIRNEYSARAGGMGQIHLGDFTRNLQAKDITGLMEGTLLRIQECADEALGLLSTRGRGVRPLSVLRYRFSTPAPGCTWTRNLDVTSTSATGATLPSTSMFEDASVRYGIYEKYLETNQIPSRIQWGIHTYTLAND